MGRHCPPTPTQAEVAAPREMGMRVRSQWSLLTPIWILEVLACPLHVSPTSLPSRPTLPAGSTGSAESLAPRKGGGGDEMALTDPRQVWGEGGRQAGSTCNSLGAGGWWVRGEPVGPRLGVCSPHPGLPGQACGFGRPSAPCLALIHLPVRGLALIHLPCVTEGFLSPPPILEGG